MRYVYTFLLFFLALGCAQHLFAHESVVVKMNNDGFEPRTVHINTGQTVRFENHGEADHWPASNIHPTHRAYPGSDISLCGTADQRSIFDACEGIKPKGSYSFTFTEPGTWRYHDHLNAKLSGTITVSRSEQITQSTVWTRIKLWLKTLTGRSKNELPTEIVSPKTQVARTHYTIREIASDDLTILADPEALYSYVHSFGTAQALQQLYAIAGSQERCHDPAHTVGRYAYETFGAEAFAECEMLCQSGCYHGAVEAYFREYGTQDIKGSMNTLCNSITNPFILHQCRHGVGHGLMAWSNYELFDALEGCDQLEDGQAERSCYGGVFMENIAQSMATYLGLNGHVTDYLSDDPHYPCTIVPNLYQADCYYLQTDRMLDLAMNDVSTVIKNCNEVEEMLSQVMCFQSLGRTIAGHYHGNAQHAYQACHLIGEVANRLHCLHGVIGNAFWDKTGTDQARDLCQTMEFTQEKNLCYSMISTRATVVMNDVTEQKEFCLTLEPDYQNWCLLRIDELQGGLTITDLLKLK